MAAERTQFAIQQREVHRLVSGNRQEIVGEVAWHSGPEPADDVEREIDSDKFDMGQRVPQRQA